MQAVIGAGAAGLVTARELQLEGHTVSVFEQDSKLGGVWNYSEDVETDMLGLDANRKRIHSSLYSTVRTNLPREIMSFSDWPFVRRFTGVCDIYAANWIRPSLPVLLQHCKILPPLT